MSTVVSAVPRGRRAALIAGILGAAIDVFYLWIIVDQGDVRLGWVAVVAGILAAASAVTFLSTRVEPFLRLMLLAGSTGTFIGLGMLSLFSIGVLLLVAGVVSTTALVGAWRDAEPIGAGGIVQVGTALLAGPLAFIAGASVT